MKGRILLGIISIILSLYYCVHIPVTNAQKVKIYYTEPEADYVSIAPIEVDPKNLFKKEQEIKWKEEATRIGGQAIIVKIEEVIELKEKGGKVAAPSYRIHGYIIRWRPKK